MAWNHKNIQMIKIYLNIPNDNGEMILYGPDDMEKAKKASSKIINSLNDDFVKLGYKKYLGMKEEDRKKLRSAI